MSQFLEDTLYFHSDKASMQERFLEVTEDSKFIPTEEAVINSRYVGYQVSLSGYWTCAGDFMVTHFEGQELESPVKI